MQVFLQHFAYNYAKKDPLDGLDLNSNPQRFYTFPIMILNRLIVNPYPYNLGLHFEGQFRQFDNWH